ncbi:hypothetical protein SNK04_000614 [Fusarium graminearum]
MKRSASTGAGSEGPVGSSIGVMLSLVEAHEGVVAVLVQERVVGRYRLHVNRLPVLSFW